MYTIYVWSLYFYMSWLKALLDFKQLWYNILPNSDPQNAKTRRSHPGSFQVGRPVRFWKDSRSFAQLIDSLTHLVTRFDICQVAVWGFLPSTVCHHNFPLQKKKHPSNLNLLIVGIEAPVIKRSHWIKKHVSNVQTLYIYIYVLIDSWRDPYDGLWHNTSSTKYPT